MENNHEKNFTLNMPKSRLSVGYTKNNQEFVHYWEENKVFTKANTYLKNKFNQNEYVLLDGPPYANGDLHLGHALNKTFKDLVVKSRWYLGQSVNFRPGWDCHGLPLELAVEKKHGRQNPSEMKVLCKELALSSVENHKKDFKALGVLSQWENPYLTLSDENLQSNWATLSDLVEKDLLVYKQYPVHYCADCGSSLAAAELETKKLPKHSLYFKVKLHTQRQEVYLLVWTTTPWTVPMNQGVAFKEQSTYYKFYSEKLGDYLLMEPSAVVSVQDYLTEQEYEFQYEVKNLEDPFEHLYETFNPLTNTPSLFAPATFVEEGKTGFVHVACAHGAEDFEWGVSLGLLPKTFLNKYGKFDTEKHLTLSRLHNASRDQANALVLEMLKDRGLLVKYSSEDQEQNVCWRHKKGVFYNATWQVFLNLEAPHFNLKSRVKKLLEESYLSTNDKEQLSLMLLNREHWCLSRQRSWGCEMNLLVDENNNLSPLSSTYLTLLSEGKTKEAESLLLQNPNLTVFKDVLDVWFDSGNVVNTYARNNGQNGKDYVVDMALEGKDQYRGWFQAMMWLSVAKNNVLPYKHLFCHGFVLNSEKEKFSKSSQNGSPLQYYLDSFGADVLHLWVASQDAGKDAVFSESKLKERNTVYSRLRLTLRYLTSNLEDYNKDKHKEQLEQVKTKDGFDFQRFLLKEMNQLHKLFKSSFETYNFKEPLEALYEFTNKTLSNFAFDWAKNPLYLRKLKSQERVWLQVGLYELLLGLLDMMKVYVPFVAEEFYQDFFNNGKSVFEVSYFDSDKEKMLDQLVVNVDWEQVMSLRKDVLGSLDELQKQSVVKARTQVGVNLQVCDKDYDLLKAVSENYRLRELFNVAFVNFERANEAKVEVKALVGNEAYDKCPKCWNFSLVEDFNNEGLCKVCDNDELEVELKFSN